MAKLAYLGKEGMQLAWVYLASDIYTQTKLLGNY